jgi:solute carrier family 35 protein C2
VIIMAGDRKKKTSAKRELRMLKGALRPKAEEVKKSICSFSYFVTFIKAIALILFYYCFSISITFYNQHFIYVS